MLRAALAAALFVVGGACSGVPHGGGPRAGGVPPETTPAPSTADEPRRAAIAVIGDMGTGDAAQRAVAAKMCRVHTRTGFEVVATTGDNVYPSGRPSDFVPKFFRPYRCLLRRGVRVRASFGNHDVMTRGGRPMLTTRAFGMKARYYSFSAGPARVVVLDSTRLNDKQLGWLDRKLADARGAPWLIAVLHHPPYSGGSEHGSDLAARAALAPRFEAAGVDLVLTGHDHVYSRARSRGIRYIVTGGGGAALYPCARERPAAVRRCRSVHHFVLLQMSESALRLRAITPDGAVVDRLHIARGDG